MYFCFAGTEISRYGPAPELHRGPGSNVQLLPGEVVPSERQNAAFPCSTAHLCRKHLPGRERAQRAQVWLSGRGGSSRTQTKTGSGGGEESERR